MAIIQKYLDAIRSYSDEGWLILVKYGQIYMEMGNKLRYALLDHKEVDSTLKLVLLGFYYIVTVINERIIIDSRAYRPTLK